MSYIDLQICFIIAIVAVGHEASTSNRGPFKYGLHRIYVFGVSWRGLDFFETTSGMLLASTAFEEAKRRATNAAG